jgi:hypothetical protein
MARWRKFGVALAFAATLGTGVLVPRTADARTLTDGQCAVLARAISNFQALQAKYPDSQLIADLLAYLQQLSADGGCS